MSKKKAGTSSSTLKKVSVERAAAQVAETLVSIEDSKRDGKLEAGPDVHPFNRVYDNQDDGVSTMDQATLLIERLRLQGYVVYFDEKLARATLAEGMRRLQQIMPE